MSVPLDPRDPTTSPADGLPPVAPADPAAQGWADAEGSTPHPFAGPPHADATTTGYPTANSTVPPQYPQPGPYPTQYPIAYAVAPVVVQQPRSNGLGVAGFVTGLLGLIFFWVPGLGLVLGALGIVLGGVAVSASRKVGSNNGLGIAGLILGIVSLIPAILVLIALSNSGR